MKSIEKKECLYDAVQFGTLDDVRSAFKACSANERLKYGYDALCKAVSSENPYTFDIVKFMVKKDVDVDTNALFFAIGCNVPCTLDIVKLLIEQGANQHERNCCGNTALTETIRCKRAIVSDYLISRDDFCLSDLIPHPKEFPADAHKIYIAYRNKVISQLIETIDKRDILYAKTVATTVAADIAKILKTEDPKPTKEDVKVLQLLVTKITTKDWVSDTQVSSDDFLGCKVGR